MRRQIDGLPEGQTAPSELEEQEQLCPPGHERFHHMRPLQVGDVVVGSLAYASLPAARRANH